MREPELPGQMGHMLESVFKVRLAHKTVFSFAGTIYSELFTLALLVNLENPCELVVFL